jgi:DNA-binding PadR family transcriptional regulator
VSALDPSTKGRRLTTYTLAAPRCGKDHGLRFMSGMRRSRRAHLHGFGPAGAGFARKARRGDIRAAILALLAESPMHGYQIIQELAERTEGAWRPSPGSVYPTLQQLEDEELVRAAESTTGKRVFELTDAGREAAGAHPEPWKAVAEEADDGLVALRELVFQVLGATRQVAAAGSKEQLEAAQAILRDARKQLYRLLADD